MTDSQKIVQCPLDNCPTGGKHVYVSSTLMEHKYAADRGFNALSALDSTEVAENPVRVPVSSLTGLHRLRDKALLEDGEPYSLLFVDGNTVILAIEQNKNGLDDTCLTSGNMFVVGDGKSYLNARGAALVEEIVRIGYVNNGGEPDEIQGAWADSEGDHPGLSVAVSMELPAEAKDMSAEDVEYGYGLPLLKTMRELFETDNSTGKPVLYSKMGEALLAA